ncbi:MULTISPECIES: hypothetical protein [unclassified Streptomyces]|uniref:hypothetical protein n=1 Tax=unclassified Streptomyces TaxID=2593676 RepID=UPI002E191C46
MKRSATLPVPAIPLGEQLADADARTRTPGLAGIAALVPTAVAQLAEQARQHPEPIDLGFAAEFPAVARVLAEQDGRPLPATLTPAETTLVPDDSLGAHRTTPIETETREIIDGAPAELPWLAAEIVVNDYRSQAYGRRTELWLHNDRDTVELTPAEARVRLRDARAFLDRFELLIDHAETVAAGDFEGDPEVYAADREAEDRRIKAISKARLAHAAAVLAEVRA